ncbi:MAG: CZB domain-containing protein, partial [Desulfurivibrionaceae bacterium]|nr:CZB domain-containing protein [Desulfurivibrionaceae bacterium]
MKMNLGVKIGAGFGAVLLVLAVVATWSILGIGTIIYDAEEVIEGNKLHGVLVQREVDHLNWAGQVNALLTDRHITELTVETDPHKCGFGQWLYGEGRLEAEKIIPELKGLFLEIEGPHTDLHQSAQKIGDVFVQADQSLPGVLADRSVDHLKWAAVIKETFLENRETLEVETNPDRCGLGKWLNGDQAQHAYGAGDSEFQEAWRAMIHNHKQLHASAAEIKGVYTPLLPGQSHNEGNGKAKEILQNKTLPLLHETLTNIELLQKEARHELKGMEQAAVIYAKQTMPHLATVQGILANLRDTVDTHIMTDQEMLAAASRTKIAVIICSFIALLAGVFIAFFMTRSITRPITKTVAMLTEMGRGRLDFRLHLERSDEIGTMAKTM